MALWQEASASQRARLTLGEPVAYSARSNGCYGRVKSGHGLILRFLLIIDLFVLIAFL